jgi:4'-phosphopantetheinyl transferase
MLFAAEGDKIQLCDELRRGGIVHLWTCFLEDLRVKAMLDDYKFLLDDHERKQEANFVFAVDKIRYRVTRALVRIILSAYLSTEPRALCFDKNAFGMPYLRTSSTDLRNLHFNVSHTEGLITLAVSWGARVGVDVELCKPTQLLDVARSLFCPFEVRVIEDMPEQKRSRKFFELWTLKESYIKARGMGLSIPLDRFYFEVVGPMLLLHRDLALKDAAQWSFWQYEFDHYLFAICRERIRHESPLVRSFSVLPLLEAKSFEPILLHATVDALAIEPPRVLRGLQRSR